jgi:hypothetical protein
LFAAVFSDSPITMLPAEAQHRGQAISEQVIVDLEAGPAAHLPWIGAQERQRWPTV